MAEQSSQSSEQAPDKSRYSPEKSNRNGRRKWYLLGLGAFFLLIGIAYGFYYFLVAQFYAATDDAYVHGNQIMLTPQRTGTVTAIHAEDTDIVAAGDTVIDLDDTDVNNRLAHASAQLGAAVRKVKQLYAQVDEQKSAIDQRRTEMDQARRDYERNRRLVKVHGVTRRAFEQSRSAWNQARAGLAAARSRLAELQAQTDNTSLRNHPQVQQAAAEVQAAYLNVRRSQVPAPATGYIAQRNVQLGQKVEPGKPMLAIVPLDRVWVMANFKETDLAAMRIGQPARVTADFYGDDAVYHGRVAGLSPGTGSAFELLPPQNATGNWIKIVRRVPVRIELDADDIQKHPLRLGLSMQVSVNLHDTSGPMLANAPPAKPPLVTHVYKQKMDGANRLIERIMQANGAKPRASAMSSGDTPTAAIGRLSPDP